MNYYHPGFNSAAPQQTVQQQSAPAVQQQQPVQHVQPQAAAAPQAPTPAASQAQASLDNPSITPAAPVNPQVTSDQPVLEPDKFVPDDKDAAKIQANEEQRQQDEVDVDTMIIDAANSVGEDDTPTKNVKDLGISIPLSSVDKIDNFVRTKAAGLKPDELREQMNDVTSDILIATESERVSSANMDALKEGLTHTDFNKLQHHYQGIGDGKGNLSSRFKDTDKIEYDNPSDALLAFNTVLSGLRQVVLWNSGFKISLRALPLYVLNKYYNAINHSDYEYGRTFGAPYYLLSDFNVTKHVVENLLPIAICNSTYKHWRNPERLRKAISFQDYPVILWAMGVMMHPNGANVNFVCAEEGCGHVTQEHVDLTKLRLLNTELLNDQIIQYFKSHGNKPVDDTDLEEYRKLLDLSKTVTFDYNQGNGTRRWEFGLQQCSLANYLDLGEEFLADMVKQVALDNENEVVNYLQYNYMRSFKPWINKISLTFKDTTGRENTIVYDMTDTTRDRSETNQIFDTIFDDIVTNNIKLADTIKDYILDTKITHIAFYFPKCPKCNREPSTSYHGYIPYDPQRNFFILALMKLLQVTSV